MTWSLSDQRDYGTAAFIAKIDRYVLKGQTQFRIHKSSAHLEMLPLWPQDDEYDEFQFVDKKWPEWEDSRKRRKASENVVALVRERLLLELQAEIEIHREALEKRAEEAIAARTKP